MLSGEESISGGIARIAGYDCETEINKVRRNLGVVPQFDAVFLSLTPRQVGAVPRTGTVAALTHTLTR